ncbi:MAG: hypothetical protein WKF73_12125 [Nocardioidaceae bacterium]
MRGRQAIGAGLAAALAAGAAWFGLSAATAGSQQLAAGSDRVEFRGWPGRSVDSIAQAQRLAGGNDNNTLTLVTEEERSRAVDLGEKGFSTGDFFVFEETVYAARGRRVVGEDTVRCEFGIRTFNCEATIKLGGRGKITVAGAFFSDRDIALPITGGTKNFSEAGGQLKVFELARDRSLLVFQLER